MLQSSSTPFTPRPRPPRSRSSQLASSTRGGQNKASSVTAASPCVPISDLDERVQDALVKMASNGPDTPPYTPELGFGELQPASNVENGGMGELRQGGVQIVRTASELEILLQDAHRAIHERERDLGIAASIGKSLLDNNIALRARQDALFHRVTVSPSKIDVVAGVSGTHPAIPFPKLQIPAYGARGEFIESLPPRSPRGSIGHPRQRQQGGTVRDIQANEPGGDAWTDEDDDRMNTSQRRSSRRHRRQGSSVSSSESAFRRSGGHHRQRSGASMSGILVTQPTAPPSLYNTPEKVKQSHHSMIGFSSTPFHLQEQHAQLSEQNVELERQLQDLEQELARADVTGKKKLRRLDRELGSLRQELESALERNRELEDSLRKKASSTSAVSLAGSEEYLPRWSRNRRPSSQPLQEQEDQIVMNALAETDMQQPTNTDTDEGLPQPEASASSGMLSQRYTFPRHASSPSNLSSKSGLTASNEAALVAQLLDKIRELEDTNASISEKKVEMDKKLKKATRDFADMSRKYDFLEERCIEAEMRNHAGIGWEERSALEWRPETELETLQVKPAPRRALGNRALIERHRRLSSLYGSQGSQQRSSTYTSSAVSTPTSTPEKPANRFSESFDHLSPPVTKSPSKLLRRSSSQLSQFFEGDPRTEKSEPTEDDDILSSMRKKAEGELKLLKASQDLFRLRDGELDSGSEREEKEPQQALPAFQATQTPSDSPSGTPKRLGHVRHTLASELAEQWASTYQTASSDASKDAQDTTSLARTPPASHASRRSFLSSFVPHKIADELVEEDDAYRFPEGAPDAESYEALERALADMPIEWADDNAALVQRTLLKDIEAADRDSQDAKTSQGGLSWAYDDIEEDDADNDPWREENRNQRAVESKEMVDFRSCAEERADRRRKRIMELAEEMLRADESEARPEELTPAAQDLMALEGSTGRMILTLRRLGSDRSLVMSEQGPACDDEEGSSDDYEHVDTARQLGSAGTDYWPVRPRARYRPSMVAQRIAIKSQQYLDMCLLWTQFLAILSVAVALSLWRGPKEGLGVRSHSGGHRSLALSRRRRSG